MKSPLNDQHIGHHITGGIVKCGDVFDIVETKYTKNKKVGDELQVLGLTYDPLGQGKELDHLPSGLTTSMKRQWKVQKVRNKFKELGWSQGRIVQSHSTSDGP